MKEYKKNKKNPDFQEIFGFHAVVAAIKNTKREHYSLHILEKYKKLSEKYSKSIKNIKILKPQEMSTKYGNENLNQGIVLKTSKIQQKSLEESVKDLKNKTNSIIIILDQVTDPNNIGSIMRSCSLFNCKTLVVSKFNTPDLSSTILKSASGAGEIVDYIKVSNLKRSLNYLKKIGYWTYALDSNCKNKINKIDLHNKCVLVLGSEGKGIRNLTKKECDFIIKLPIKANEKYGIDSLNVSNAGAIALYEHYKKFN